MIQSFNRKGLLPLALLLAVSGFCLAHVDDPKVRDRQPPYRGPGFRASLNTKTTVDFPSQDINLQAWLPLAEFGLNHTAANDCWGYVSPSGREYAIIGLTHGTGFVNLDDPGNPVVVATIAGPNSIWRDVKVYDQYAYSVNENSGGIQVIDMTQIDQGIVTLANTVTTGGTDQTHNVFINEDSGYLYRCGGNDNGLRIYSLGSPELPVYVNAWPDRYVHDVQVVNYTEGPYMGKEIAFCASGFNGGSVMTGLSILDVTDKFNIQVLSHFEYPQAAYSHQGWLSEDRQYFYMNDELDERAFGFTSRSRVLDVSDLENPSLVSTFSSGTNAIDHNLYVVGNTIFEANYRSGLRIFDATDPIAPVEVGFFDTYIEDDASNFNGLWNVYPFLPSGVIVGSDIEKGLFVWTRKGPTEVNSRLLYPWVSNSNEFESNIIVNNFGTEPAAVTLTARRQEADQTETSEEFIIPARGFLNMKAADLFEELGVGGGYTVEATSDATNLSGRWVTNDRVAFSPSQGLAVPVPTDPGATATVAPSVEFGFLPGDDNFQAVPVLVNPNDSTIDITVHYFNEAGEWVDTGLYRDVPPYAPVIAILVTAETGNLYAVATASSGNVTGAVFVFNSEGQTAIGNVSAVENYQAPTKR